MRITVKLETTQLWLHDSRDRFRTKFSKYSKVYVVNQHYWPINFRMDFFHFFLLDKDYNFIAFTFAVKVDVGMNITLIFIKLKKDTIVQTSLIRRYPNGEEL